MTATTGTPAHREQNRIRFETELEFIQCLANPYYLQSLAQQGYFDDQAFLNYLNYLKYWQEPKFARFIQYPQALHHLALLTYVPPSTTSTSATAATSTSTSAKAESKSTTTTTPSNPFILTLKSSQTLAQDLAGKQLAHWAGWREPGAVEGRTAGANGEGGKDPEGEKKEDGMLGIEGKGVNGGASHQNESHAHDGKKENGGGVG